MSDFSMTEMLTTAGSTFFTMGAKLGIGTIADPAPCVCANATMGAAVSATEKTAPTASRRNRPADIVENIMDQPRLKEDAIINGTARGARRRPRHRPAPDFRAHHRAGRITPPLRFD